jgi:glucose-1-phosphate adenylyltransferase
VSGSTLYRSLLCDQVHVHSYGRIQRSVILPLVDVGRRARLSDAVVDAGVRIPEGLVVGEDAGLDAARFRRTSRGIVLITQSMIDRLPAAR